MRWVGIDPGVNGAVAWINKLSPEHNDLAYVEDLPVLDGYVDPMGLDTVAKRWIQEGAIVTIERQIAMPKQSVNTTAKVFQNYGIILGVIKSLGFVVHTPRPKDWKKDMRLSSVKDESLTRAKELYPHMHHKLARKKDHDRAEALLLARWCQQQDGFIL